MAAPILAPCIETPVEPEPEPEPELKPVKETEPTAAPANEDTKPIVVEEKPEVEKPKAATAAASTAEMPAAATPVPNGKSPKAPAKKKSPLPIIIGVVTALALVIGGVALFGGGSSSSSSTTEQAPVITPIPEGRTLISDQRLVGPWRAFDVQHNGQAKASVNSYGGLSFTYYGEYYGDIFTKISSMGTPYNPIGTASLSGDSITFMDMSSLFGSDDVAITYSFEPLTDEEVASIIGKKSSDIQKPYSDLLRGDGNQALVLHITGTIRESSTVVKSIDTTMKLAKKFPLYDSGDFLNGVLVGSWTDNYGGAWTFENAADVFTMTNDAGKVSRGRYVNCGYNEKGETVSFLFEDYNESISYATINSVEYDTIRLTQRDGGELIFTRVS